MGFYLTLLKIGNLFYHETLSIGIFKIKIHNIKVFSFYIHMDYYILPILPISINK